MDFADEPYVRLYTRRTLTSRLLGWEGRVVLRMMLDEFDGAGIFPIRGDAAVCIAAVTELPLELARVGLERLIETETWRITESVIAWPTYEEAQNCSRSDRARQRESRRARAERAVTPVTRTSRAVTDVTTGHDESHAVTPLVGARAHASSLPPSHPSSHPRASRAPTHVATPEPKSDPSAAVARTHSLPSEEPTQEYLDAAAMAGVSHEQARSTWEHYWGDGLPARGVERPVAWLVKRAKERSNQLTRATPGRKSSREHHQPDAGIDPWQKATIL